MQRSIIVAIVPIDVADAAVADLCVIDHPGEVLQCRLPTVLARSRRVEDIVMSDVGIKVQAAPRLLDEWDVQMNIQARQVD